MKRIILSLMLAFATLVSYAQFGKKVVGNNKYTEVFHKVGEYNKLVVSNVKANVVYLDEVDSAGVVRIYGEENVVSLIDVSSEKETVTIKTKGMKNSEHGLLMIYVFCSKISTIDLTGGVIFETNDPMKQTNMKLAITGDGQIQIHNLVCDRLKISLLGDGDVYIGGKSKEANYSIVGGGEIRADKFEVENLSAKLIGNGNIGCNATKLLKATITGVGNIYYRGKAELKSTIIGTGNLKPLQ